MKREQPSARQRNVVALRMTTEASITDKQRVDQQSEDLSPACLFVGQFSLSLGDFRGKLVEIGGETTKARSNAREMSRLKLTASIILPMLLGVLPLTSKILELAR